MRQLWCTVIRGALLGMGSISTVLPTASMCLCRLRWRRGQRLFLAPAVFNVDAIYCWELGRRHKAGSCCYSGAQAGIGTSTPILTFERRTSRPAYGVIGKNQRAQ